MSILSVILGFIGKVFTDVFLDILKTPAQEISVESSEGVLDTLSTDTDSILDQFGGLLDRS